MLKKILPAAAGLALFAAPGLAAVQGSHHDLSTWTGGTTAEVCLYCHGVTSTVTNATDYGAIGDLCVSRCHRGAAGYGASDNVLPNRPGSIAEDGTPIAPVATVNAVNVNDGFGHGLDRADLLGPLQGNGADNFDALGGGLPYTGGTNATTAVMECTSCHNVHDYTNTPFLQRNLFTGGPAARPSFCEACHTTRGNSWAGGETAPNGEHPTNFALVLGDVTTRTNAERRGRYIALDAASAAVWAGGDGAAATAKIFDVVTANGAALSAASSNYRTGGKVSGFGTAAAGNTFGCYTCHSAHQDNVSNKPNLIVRAGYSVSGEWNPLCVGCHGDVANGLDDPNPGLQASLYWHPVGTTANAQNSAVGHVVNFNTDLDKFAFNVNLQAIRTLGAQNTLADGICGIDGGATNPGDATVTSKPRCTSCHDVHGGISNSQALIDLDGNRDGTFSGSICETCHGGEGLPDVADNATQTGEVKGAGTQGSHHRTRAGSWAAGIIQDADNDFLVMDAASWTIGGAAPTTASLGCADCHVFDGSVHSTAHNW